MTQFEKDLQKYCEANVTTCSRYPDTELLSGLLVKAVAALESYARLLPISSIAAEAIKEIKEAIKI